MKNTRSYQKFQINNVQVTLEKLDNHPNINTLHKLNFGNCGSMLDLVGETKYANKHGDELGIQIAVARYKNKIIGWSCLDHWPETDGSYNRSRYYIYVYVSTRYRKRGVGSKLLKEMYIFCKKNKYTVKVCGHDRISYSFFKIKNRMGRHIECYREMKDATKRP